MKIQIDAIQVKPGRREANTQHIRELEDSIKELGLLNPVTVDKDNALVLFWKSIVHHVVEKIPLPPSLKPPIARFNAVSR